MSTLTPSQTVGPYFQIGLDWPADRRVAQVADAAIMISGQVTDGDGAAVTDAMIEIWQADGHGRYHSTDAEGFCGLGRAATDSAGRYRFTTEKPGAVDDAQTALQAPHINVVVFARGLLTHLYTRLYFAEDESAHASDPVLSLVPAARRDTLIAQRSGAAYVFDIRLRGEHETVFFEL